MGGGAKRNVRDLQRSVAGVPDGDFQRSRYIVRRHLAEVVVRGEHLLHRTCDRPAGRRRTGCRCRCVRASRGTAHCKQCRQTECNDSNFHTRCPSESADRVRFASAFGWKECPHGSRTAPALSQLTPNVRKEDGGNCRLADNYRPFGNLDCRELTGIWRSIRVSGRAGSKQGAALPS